MGYSQTHWSKEQATLQYIDKVLVPYVAAQRQLLNLPHQQALAICDVFAAHRTGAVRKMLQDNRISVIYVPAGATGAFNSNSEGLSSK